MMITCNTKLAAIKNLTRIQLYDHLQKKSSMFAHEINYILLMDNKLTHPHMSIQ